MSHVDPFQRLHNRIDMRLFTVYPQGIKESDFPHVYKLFSLHESLLLNRVDPNRVRFGLALDDWLTENEIDYELFQRQDFYVTLNTHVYTLYSHSNQLCTSVNYIGFRNTEQFLLFKLRWM